MDFEIRKCGREDIDTIVGLIQAVYEQMEQKECFAADNSEYTRKVLAEGRGTAWMAVEKESGQPAGVFMAAIPSVPGEGIPGQGADGISEAGAEGISVPENTQDDYEENLGRDIGLPESELGKVAHMDSAAVLPAFRGFHLQRRLMKTAEEELRKEGFRYLCCTVHPDNESSLRSVLSQGYRIAKTCEKYGGSPRHILVRELE